MSGSAVPRPGTDSFPPDTMPATRQRKALWLLAFPLVVFCLVASLESDYWIIPIFVGIGAAIGWLVRHFSSAYKRLEIDARGVRLITGSTPRELDWKDVGRVHIVAWHHKAESRTQMAGMLGGAIGAAIMHQDQVDPNVDPDAQLLDQLSAIGMPRSDILPDIRIHDRNGKRVFRMKGSHGWDAAKVLAQRAVALRVETVIGPDR